MSEVKKCPRCGGEMVQGSSENLVRNFACTRGKPKPEDQRKVKVYSYYCKSCGYLEFYRRLARKERQTPSLLEDVVRASEVHEKEKEG